MATSSSPSIFTFYYFGTIELLNYLTKHFDTRHGNSDA